MGQLEGRVAIVTGSAGAGVGQATARLFGAEGAQVVVTDINVGRTEKTAAALSEEFGREFPAIPMDVRDRESVEALVQATLDRYGRIDVLVNNAYRDIECRADELTDEIWDAVVDVCLRGTFNCTRAVLPTMMEQRSGSIVSLASVSSYSVKSAARRAHYSAAKAGVQGFSRGVAADMGEYGIRSNVVMPASVPNEWMRQSFGDDFMERSGQDHPFGRGAKPEEIANVILFLASDQSSYLTGEVIGAGPGKV